MSRLDRLWQALKLLSSARDLARETRQLEWSVSPPNTFYLQAEHCDISLAWHDRPIIMAKLELDAGIGWQWKSDQDEAGVYLALRRKPVLGSIGKGKCSVKLPPGVHISLELEDCQVCIQGLSATLDLPPSLWNAGAQELDA